MQEDGGAPGASLRASDGGPAMGLPHGVACDQPLAFSRPFQRATTLVSQPSHFPGGWLGARDQGSRHERRRRNIPRTMEPLHPSLIRDWHAHVYFEAATREAAWTLRESIETELGDRVQVGRF